MWCAAGRSILPVSCPRCATLRESSSPTVVECNDGSASQTRHSNLLVTRNSSRAAVSQTPSDTPEPVDCRRGSLGEDQPPSLSITWCSLPPHSLTDVAFCRSAVPPTSTSATGHLSALSAPSSAGSTRCGQINGWQLQTASRTQHGASPSPPAPRHCYSSCRCSLNYTRS